MANTLKETLFSEDTKFLGATLLAFAIWTCLWFWSLLLMAPYINMLPRNGIGGVLVIITIIEAVPLIWLQRRVIDRKWPQSE